MKIGTIAASVVAVLVVIVGLMSVYTVHETEQAVLLAFGQAKKAEQEAGLHFKLPHWEVQRLSDLVINLDMDPEEVTTSDQKRLDVDAYARFRIVDPLKMYRSVRTVSLARDQITKLLRSQLREVLGRQKLETLLSDQRTVLMEEIRSRVDTEAQGLYGIDIVDVRIRRADLPPANTEAILRRMESERLRDAQRARSEGQEQKLRIEAEADREATVLLAEAEREAALLRGQGERESTRIFAEAFGQDEDFFAFYRTMQAYKKSLTGQDTTLIISPESEFFDFFSGLDRADRPNR
ncbi:MAG: protease modulator HflC [Rhodothalassiaceae bacterium]